MNRLTSCITWITESVQSKVPLMCPWELKYFFPRKFRWSCKFKQAKPTDWRCFGALQGQTLQTCLNGNSLALFLKVQFVISWLEWRMEFWKWCVFENGEKKKQNKEVRLHPHLHTVMEEIAVKRGCQTIGYWWTQPQIHVGQSHSCDLTLFSSVNLLICSPADIPCPFSPVAFWTTAVFYSGFPFGPSYQQ